MVILDIEMVIDILRINIALEEKKHNIYLHKHMACPSVEWTTHDKFMKTTKILF